MSAKTGFTTDQTGFEDQLAFATQSGPSAPAERATGVFADLVLPGSSVPIIEVPMAARIGIDTMPSVPHHWVMPSLCDIAKEDLDTKIDLLFARPFHVESDDEREMIAALPCGYSWICDLVRSRLDLPRTPPLPPEPKPKPKRTKPARRLPGPIFPDLFSSSGTNMEESDDG